MPTADPAPFQNLRAFSIGLIELTSILWCNGWGSIRYLSKIDSTDASCQILPNRSSGEKAAFTIPGFGILLQKVNVWSHKCSTSVHNVLGVDLLLHVCIFISMTILASEDFALNIFVYWRLYCKISNLMISTFHWAGGMVQQVQQGLLWYCSSLGLKRTCQSPGLTWAI